LTLLANLPMLTSRTALGNTLVGSVRFRWNFYRTDEHGILSWTLVYCQYRINSRTHLLFYSAEQVPTGCSIIMIQLELPAF
jgi:hypothetical protein